ncbi:hypothetical protein AB0892_08475 [Streptomyces sp. NPDC005409]|uniref:hypothetical protein n=1 Tax=Streptomyces sp. NPDC005409 TaxID=3155342 RepID=UPI003455E315
MLERKPRKDRTEVTFVLPVKSEHTFRYLAAGDYWFDEESADSQDGLNSRVRA